MSASPLDPAPRLTMVQWLVCVIAAIGFAFDIYELLMLPLVVRFALQELGGFKPGDDGFVMWTGLLFYVPALVGGLIGLWGGYLTDRLGRRFVLTWSILLYAVSAFLAGFSTSLPMLLFFRTLTFVGVCVEFVAAVAWLAELFPNPIQREKVLGYTQAFSSFGGLLVAVANGMAYNLAGSLPAIAIPSFMAGIWGQVDPAHQHEAWRYTLMSGLIPAIPLIVIRPFLPESPAWLQKRAAGTLKRPSIAELFSPQFRRTTIVTTIMFACSYGAAFGAIQQLRDIVPGIKEVKQKAEGMKPPVRGELIGKTNADYTKAQEVGGLVGRFALAILATIIISRRSLLRVFQIPGLILMPLVFYAFAVGDNTTYWTLDVEKLVGEIYVVHEIKVSFLGLCIFLAGLFTVAQFSFWGNYLPRVYPLHLRGTGESFAANIGGRMIGTSFAALTPFLAGQAWAPGSTPPQKLALMAAAVAFFVYAVGSIACFWLPEPREGEFED